MRQWKSLVPAALHLHGPAASCFPHPPSPSPCPSPPRSTGEEEKSFDLLPPPLTQAQGATTPATQQQKVVRLVGCDGKVRSYAPPVTARELMQEHPRHLVCRADALLIGEKIPAVAPGDELQPGEAYFLLPQHLFRSVLSFVSLASSLLLLLSSSGGAGAAAGTTGKKKNGGGSGGRPFELHRTASGTLQIKFSDDFLLADAASKGADGDADAPTVLLRGDERLAKDYEELVGYGKSRRWAPKLETIEEVVLPLPAAAPTPAAAESAADPATASPRAHRSRRSRALPFLGRLGSRRRSSHRGDACSSSSAVVACSG